PFFLLVKPASFAAAIPKSARSCNGLWRSTTDVELRKHAPALVALAPDVLLAGASSVLGALQQATHTIPIVFCQVTDPVGGGYVASVARPSGNTTGFRSDGNRLP